MERTPLAPGVLRESPLVPLDAYWVLVLHVGRGIAPAAMAEQVRGRGVRWKGTMWWQIDKGGWEKTASGAGEQGTGN